jgi:hypothetical protein
MKKISIVALLLASTSFAHAQKFSGVPVANLTNVAQAIKTARGTLAWASCNNPNSSVEYLQFFDSIGTITVGTTAPKFWLPVNASLVQYFANLDVIYLAGLQVAFTTTPAGGAAPSSNAQCSFGVN